MEYFTSGQKVHTLVFRAHLFEGWMALYPLDNSIGFASVYPLDIDLSGG